MTILKIPRLWPALQVSRASTAPDAIQLASSAAEGLDAFGSEADPVAAPKIEAAPKVPAPALSKPVPPWVLSALKWSAVVVVTAALAIAGVIEYQRRFARAASTGGLTIETTPAGLDVVLAGKSLGKTPLTTSLAAGSYDLQIGPAPNARTVKVTVTAGTTIVQRMEFAEPSLTAGPVTGGLRVQTEPAHLPVFVDGTAHGAAPVSIENLEPGEHEISVRTAAGVVRRAVTVQPHETLSLIVSSAAPAPDPSAVSAGWITVSSPIPLQMREGGKVIGTSESEKLMMTAGDHDIEFTNESLGFTARKTVKVVAGKTAPAKIDLPNGVLSVNAQPWAEVWIDGERVGETPIGNLSRRIGNHEVVFRHPELGERRENVVITVGKPARIGVDLRKK